MPSPEMQSFTLACHAATPTEVVRTLQAQVTFSAHGTMALRYVLEAQLDRLRIAKARAAARRDELWKHTCFEAFLATGEGGAYRELNFSPSTEWAMYAFERYRHGMSPVEGAAPEIVVRREAGRLTLEASVQAVPAVRLALAAVIEDDSGTLSYWALRHPPGKPDFHHPGSFIELS